MLGFGACGSADLEPGTAVIDGQVDGHGITPQTAFLVPSSAAEWSDALVISEDPEYDCDSLDEDPVAPSMAIAFPCGDARVATYTLETKQTGDCVPDTAALMWFYMPEDGEYPDLYEVQSGTVTIAERDSEMITGWFTANFDDGALSGAFSARICP